MEMSSPHPALSCRLVTSLATPVRVAAELGVELAATAVCAARYPLGLVEGAVTTGRPSGRPDRDTPVVLVHGYGHNRSGWWVLDRHLRQAGFTSVHRMNYLPLNTGVPALARRLARRVDEVLALTGARRVHVVAHSLGGILLRWYVQELGGDRYVETAVTLGCPHEGTATAYLAPERTARQLCPGSEVITRLAAGARPSPVRWVAVYSDADLLVWPTSAAGLRAPALAATNIEIHGLGHLSMLIDSRVVAVVTAELEAAEGSRGPEAA
jgi:triacylglycerol lipase